MRQDAVYAGTRRTRRHRRRASPKGQPEQNTYRHPTLFNGPMNGTLAAKKTPRHNPSGCVEYHQEVPMRAIDLVIGADQSLCARTAAQRYGRGYRRGLGRRIRVAPIHRRGRVDGRSDWPFPTRRAAPAWARDRAFAHCKGVKWSDHPDRRDISVACDSFPRPQAWARTPVGAAPARHPPFVPREGERPPRSLSAQDVRCA